MAILPIGFFMPLPLAMMIPFMGIQSAVMMKQAGENWQYGKRLQSAMSNEEFNAQTMGSIFAKNVMNVKDMIPTMEQAIKDMRPFQDFIITEMIELLRRGLETGLGAIFGLSPEQSNAFFGGTNPLNPDATPVLPEPGVILKTLTGTQVNLLSITQLNIIVETKSNLAEYDETTQLMLTARYNALKNVSPPEPDPGIPLTDVNFAGVLALITDKMWNELRSTFRVTALKSSTNYQEWQTTINLQYSQIVKAWKAAGGSSGPDPGKSTSWESLNRQKLGTEALIVFVNSKVTIPTT